MITYKTNLPSANTPRNGNTLTVPSSYEVEELQMINQFGEKADIRELLMGFTITEELFSPIIVFNGHFRDTINFFENFALNGQEIIRIRLKKSEESSREPRLELYFTVKEYPNFVKTNDTLDAQEYTVIAVSEHAYLSLLQRISRSVHGNPIENIRSIFVTDLNVNPENIVIPVFSGNPCVTQFDGVITTQSPLRAIEWLRTKAYDAVGSPFFVYSTIVNGDIYMRSWNDLISDRRFPADDFVYQLKQYVESTPGTTESYAERMRQILSLASNIRLDKLSQALQGGFGTRLQETDFSLKSFVDKPFAKSGIVGPSPSLKSVLTSMINQPDNWADALGFLSGRSTVPRKSFGELTPSITQISTTSGSNNSSEVLKTHAQQGKQYLANLQAESHEITVYGDFLLNPGRKIYIEIPKAGNVKERGVDKNIDTRLSGEYIVAVAAHVFEDGVYTTRAKIIRDNV